MGSLKDDVNDIRARVFARQTADTLKDSGVEPIDIPSKGRGKEAGMNASIKEIAEAIGMGDNKYAVSNASKFCKKAIEKMTRNYIYVIISDAAMKMGFTEDDAIDIAALSYRDDIEKGMTDREILRGLLDA